MQHKIQHSCDKCGSSLNGAVEHGSCEHCGAYYSIVQMSAKSDNIIDEVIIERLKKLAGVNRSTAGAGINK